MNKTKKCILIVSAIVCFLIGSMFIALNFIKVNVKIDLGSPIYVNVFNHSTNAISTNEQTKDKMIDKVYEITNVSALEKLLNRVSLDRHIYQDNEKKYATWTTDIKNNNLVIELTYTSQQDVVIYKGKDSRVISYYSLAIVIPNEEGFTEIPVYYAFTTETEVAKNTSYAECTPIILYGNAKSFSNYISSL